MEQPAVSIEKAAIKNEFTTKISRLTSSSAYLDFCAEVSGYRIYLFNMMDKEQIDFVLNSIPITAEDRLLDLGCGSGSLTQLIMAKYGCSATGIDLLEPDLVERGGSKMTYICGDIDETAAYQIKPTITLAVDSLYFCHDLPKLLRQLTSIRPNTLYLFYSQYLFEETATDKSLLASANTRLAVTLKQQDIPFRTVDFSANERLLYDNMLQSLPKHKRAFELENNLDLYQQKLLETQTGRELYEKGLASRYLYIIEAR